VRASYRISCFAVNNDKLGTVTVPVISNWPNVETHKLTDIAVSIDVNGIIFLPYI
jgi:hypothetical protein